MSDGDSAKAFRLIYFFQKLIEDSKQALRSLFAEHKETCAIDIDDDPPNEEHPGGVISYFYVALTTVTSMFTTPTTTSSQDLGELAKKAGLSPLGCGPLKSLAEVLSSATRDNKVTWRLAHKKFTEHRVGKTFALGVLIQMVQSAPTYHDPLLSMKLLVSGSGSSRENTYVPYTNQEWKELAKDFVTENKKLQQRRGEFWRHG